MHVVLSIVSVIVLVGEAIAIARFRPYWPFDHYPMYSFPVARMRYPIVRGDQLTMFSLVEVKADGTTADLLSGAHIYPETFHPLDRIEIVVLLVRAGMLQGVEHVGGATNQIEARGAGSLAKVQQALSDLLAYGRTNRPELHTLRLVAMEWSDFRDRRSDFTHPDRVRVIAEVSHSVA